LDNIAVTKYEINPNLPLDPIFYDILCINCYECVKANEVDFHSEYCIIQSNEGKFEFYILNFYQNQNFKDNNMNDIEEDYNSKIYKLHCSLKYKLEDIENTNDMYLIKIFNEMLEIIYEILINNNVIQFFNLKYLLLNI
jgi:hypothetical protein